MRSNQTSIGWGRGENRCADLGGLEPVGIGSDLIAFYPHAIHHPQPYVILLDPASGILKRLDLQGTK
jgi:hypothetical protein